MSTDSSPSTVVSVDGTVIAFDRRGDGPPLVVVLGAFNDRSTHEGFAAELSRNFTVFSYDRRGRGESGDAARYSIDHEIADLTAVAEQADGIPAVFGYSSGAILALAAVAGGLPVSGLALYDPAPVTETDQPGALAGEIDRLVSAGERGAAVELFQTAVVGIPEPFVKQIRSAPFRPALEAMAHTLVYDTTIVGGELIPAKLAPSVSVPTLVLVGEANPQPMHASASAIASAIADARFQVLDGQTHDIVPEIIAPALTAFLIDRQ